MTENKASDLVIDTFKGVGALSGTVGLATGSKTAIIVSMVSAIAVDAMESARGGASFIGRLIITGSEEGKTYRDVARKLRSKTGAKVTVDAIKTLSDSTARSEATRGPHIGLRVLREVPAAALPIARAA